MITTLADVKLIPNPPYTYKLLINTYSSSSQQENTECLVIIEPLYRGNSVLCFNTSSKHLIRNALHPQVKLNYFKHSLKLGENEHFMVFLFELFDELIKKYQLA